MRHEPMDDGYKAQNDEHRPPVPETMTQATRAQVLASVHAGSRPARHEPADDGYQYGRTHVPATVSLPTRHEPGDEEYRRYPPPSVLPQYKVSSNTWAEPMHDEVIRKFETSSRVNAVVPPHDEVAHQHDHAQTSVGAGRLPALPERPSRKLNTVIEPPAPAQPTRSKATTITPIREISEVTANKPTAPRPDHETKAGSHSRQASHSLNLPSPDGTLRVWSPRNSFRSSFRTSSDTPPSSVADSRPRLSLASSVGYLGDKVYLYSSLGQNEIRLVKILPARKSAVQCEILHADLDNPPKYLALSYAWGDAMDTRKVQIEGYNVPITASLHSALVALRLKNEPVLVWADALSINQQDREERTEQVKLMTRIYSGASHVAMWLGPEADDSSLALEFLRELNHASSDNSAVQKLLRSPEKERSIAATVALFERDYWKRLWIVQEVSKAKVAVVFCGSAQLSWTKCCASRDLFTQYRSIVEEQYPSGKFESQNQLSYSQVLIHHGPGSLPGLSPRPENAQLSQILRACRKKLSFDPRDKVFGLLGLMPEDVQQDFQVDYELSVKEVYTDVVDVLLNVTERLDVICEAVHFPLHTSPHRLPSWVPDWSHVAQVSAIGPSFDFKASKDTKVDFSFEGEARNKLEINAVHLDHVGTHGVSVGTFCTTADFLMAFLHWRAILLGSDLLGPDVTDAMKRKSVHDTFCRTLCLAQIPAQWEHTWTEVVYHIFSSMLHTRLPYLPLDTKLAQHITYDLGVPLEQHRGLMHQHIGARVRGRTFCITKKGWLGMGTGFMAPGDEIVVPFGCCAPILLRREGSRGEYRLVGDVYIDGYMEGRAIDEWKQGKLSNKRYTLR